MSSRSSSLRARRDLRGSERGEPRLRRLDRGRDRLRGDGPVRLGRRRASAADPGDALDQARARGPSASARHRAAAAGAGTAGWVSGTGRAGPGSTGFGAIKAPSRIATFSAAAASCGAGSPSCSAGGFVVPRRRAAPRHSGSAPAGCSRPCPLRAAPAPRRARGRSTRLIAGRACASASASMPVATTEMRILPDQGFVEGRAEDDVGFGIDLLADAVGGLVDLEQGHVEAAGDVDQDAAWRPSSTHLRAAGWRSRPRRRRSRGGRLRPRRCPSSPCPSRSSPCGCRRNRD